MAKQGKAWRAVELADAKRMTAGVVHHRWPCWSLDGKWLAFAADDAWVIVDRRGRVARVLEGPADGGACFGADGSFAYGRRAGSTSEVWMTPGGGSPPVRLLGGDGGLYREPAWSPDGTRLVIAHTHDGSQRTRLLSLDLATGARRLLTQDPARIDGRASFAPDGVTLFFEGAVGGDAGIYALEHGQLSRVTPHGPAYRRPAPLSADLLIVERQHDAASPPRLVLVDWRQGRERELDTGSLEEGREPAVGRQKGKLRLAWSSLPLSDGKPRRSDVIVARLRGLEALLSEPLPIETLPESPPPSTPDEGRAPKTEAAPRASDEPARA